MRARRSMSRGSRARSLKGSAGRVKWWRRGRRVPPSTGCAKRPLVFPDDADDDALHDDVTLVDPERLHRVIRRLQPDPAAGLAVIALDRGTLTVDERDDGLPGVGLITFLNDYVVAVFDVLIDHRVAPDFEH